MRQFVLDYCRSAAIIFLIAPLPLYIALVTWVFKLRFCKLMWSPFCSKLLAERWMRLSMVTIFGVNLLAAHGLAARGKSDVVVVLMLTWTLACAAVMTRYWWQAHRVVRKELYDPQLWLPLCMPYTPRLGMPRMPRY